MALNIKDNMFEQSDVRETITNTEDVSIAFNTDYARFDSTATVVGGYNIFISPDGLNFYTSTSSSVAQYTLSVAWDITTATLLQTKDLSAISTAIYGLWFKDDGLKMYITSNSGTKRIVEFDLSTAWDVDTATELQDFELAATGYTGLFMRGDGKQFYIYYFNGSVIQGYSLTTAWDITTAVLMDTLSFTSGNDMFFSRDGSHIFMTKGATLEDYVMTSVYRISTGTTSKTFTVFPTGSISSIFFKANGTKMYTRSGNNIRQYSIKRGWR